jgi:hypothetical protein
LPKSRERSGGVFLTDKRTGLGRRGALVACMALTVLLGPLSPAGLSAAETGAAPEGYGQEARAEVRGYISTKYVARSASFSGEDFEDHDVFEYARFDASSPEGGRYELHFFGAARQDVDGGRDRKGFSPLEDIGDTWKRGYSGQLYDAHLAINRPLSHVRQARFGRQPGTRDEPVFFDGVSADLALTDKVSATVYGGAAVHFYELDYDWGEDLLGGVGVDYSPTFGSVVSLDYLYVRDQRELFGFSDQQDNLYAIKLWHRFAPYLRTMARFRYLDGEPRDLKMSAVGTFPDAGFQVSATYFRQLSAQKELSNELSIYYDVVGTTTEYQSFDLKLRKFLGEHYAIDVGYYGRALVGGDEESAFNRDYSRYYAAFDISGLPAEALSFSFTGEYWKSEADSYWTGGLDASYAFRSRGKRGELGAGSYYSLYKYDYYIERGEREEVQTYYARAVMPVGRGFSANARYEYEDGSVDYSSLSFGVRYEF